MEPPLFVGEDQEIIDVADVAQSQPVGDKVIERVEVDIGEELARLVAERQPPVAVRWERTGRRRGTTSALGPGDCCGR